MLPQIAYLPCLLKSLPLSFKIYNASAGAGKTYSLVQNYLELCLANNRPDVFLRILAITFTNKAANEMKQRLVKALREIAEYPETNKSTSLALELANHFEVSPETIAVRAKNTLSKILHNYSAFAISTIDSFTNRLIRSFSRDLKLSANYHVELDASLILSEAIDLMLEKMERNDSVARVLTKFIERQLEEGKSPHIEQALHKTGMSIFNENAQPYLKMLHGFTADDFLATEKKLWALQRAFQKNLKEKAGALLHYMDEAGLEPTDFSGKYFYNQTRDRAQGKIEPYTDSVQEMILGTKTLYAKSNKTGRDKILPHEAELLSRASEIASLFGEDFEFYCIREKVLKNLYSTAVLSEIEKNLQEVKEESSRLPIGDFNKLISQYLREQPAPFIYEKIGDKYRHYFIDEFQDTSVLQWQNLLPLVHNALSEEHTSAMLVGDAKQAIYRWRGGDVQQFVDLCQPSGAGPDLHPLEKREITTLPHNWRSRKEVVEFNNAFFAFAAKSLNDPQHQELFEKGHQNVKRAAGGYVEVNFVDHPDKEQYDLNQCEESLRVIEDALSRGYKLSDMAILVRSNKSGALLAQFMVERQIPVISPDSLQLSGSAVVQAAISFFQMLNRPDDKSKRLPWLEYLYKARQSEISEHEFLQKHSHESLRELIGFTERVLPNWSFKEHELRSLTEKVYYLLEALGINFRQDPYLQSFIDLVNTFEQEEGSIESAFLRWWEQSGQSKSVDLPAGVDAVQIMSIHKAKGLEFPIVVFAFADLNLHQQQDSEEWQALPVCEELANLPAAKISFSQPKNLPEDGLYTSWYNKYLSRVQLDQLNMVYVAFTRAENELYVLSSDKIGKEQKKLPEYLENFFKAQGKEKTVFGEKGQAQDSEKVEENLVALENLACSPWEGRLKMSLSAPKNWTERAENERETGKKMHYLLAQIKETADLEKALANSIKRGDFDESEKDTLQAQVQAVLGHPKLHQYFNSGLEVLNERNILIPGKGRRIPDRVVLAQTTAHVIDYKTGEALPGHQKQIDDYMSLLQEMGYAAGDKVLVYLGDEIVVERW